MAHALGFGPDLSLRPVHPAVYGAGCEIARRCGHWMAHPNRPTDSRNARNPKNGSIFVDDGRQALVCLGVALRRGRGRTGECCWIEWSRLVHGGDYCRRVWLDVSAVGPAGDEHIFGAVAGAAGIV